MTVGSDKACCMLQNYQIAHRRQSSTGICNPSVCNCINRVPCSPSYVYAFVSLNIKTTND